MLTVWNRITDIGDASVTLPLALFVLIHLALIARWRRAALAWAVAITACGIAMILLKIGIRACAVGLERVDLISPSGHSAMSTTVYGCLALLVAGQWRDWRRAAILGTALLLIFTIAVSRLIVHAHTGIEVLIGLAVGTGTSLLFHLMMRRGTTESLQIPRLALGGLAVICLFYGGRLPAEIVLIRIAMFIHHSVPACSQGV